MRPYFEKNPSQKRAGGEAQGVGPKVKPQYRKKKKKKRTRLFLYSNGSQYYTAVTGKSGII
jgi:hypothetical protein